MKDRINLCFLCMLLTITCNAATTTSEDTQAHMLTQAVSHTVKDIFTLKNLMIDVDFVFPDGEHVRGVKMNTAAISKFKPQNIDEFYAMGDTYYVVDTIATSRAGSVYLIVKHDPNETSGWLVIYDTGMKVMDQIEVYYENAEGNFYLNSSILDNIVTTTGDNITPEENPVSAFKIVEGPRWQIIEH